MDTGHTRRRVVIIMIHIIPVIRIPLGVKHQVTYSPHPKVIFAPPTQSLERKGKLVNMVLNVHRNRKAS